MKTKLFFWVFAILGCALAAQAQAPPLTATVTGLNQCVYVQGTPYMQLEINVSGVFAGTLYPFVQATPGAQRQPWTVTPAGSATPQTQITAAGTYMTALSTPTLLSFCFDYWISGAANLAISVENGGGGGGGVSIPIQISPAPAASQSNECASVISNGAGGTVTASPVLQSTDSTGVGHDVMCVVITSTRAADVGGIVFPYYNSSNPSASASQDEGGNWEVGGGVGRLTLSNTAGSNRHNNFSWRSCAGGCGTDWSWIEDNASVGNEDMTWLGGTSNAALYITGNCPAPGCATTFVAAGGPQFLISDGPYTATTNPAVGVVGGHLAHGGAGGDKI